MISRPPLAEQFDLQPHPEGGWFRETFRSATEINPDGYAGPRAAATAIYFLLNPGEESAWHVVTSDELWFFHSGGPLTLRLGGAAAAPAPGAPSPTTIAAGATPADTRVIVLGVGAGQQPQALVPAGVWQSAAPASAEPVLVSCVVSPGFDFADFRLNHA